MTPLPSSRHLSHDFPAWKGLSLRELFWTVMMATPLVTLLFVLIGLIAGFPMAFGAIGFLIGFILSITIIPKSLARMKAGKPYGFVKKQTIRWMAHYHIQPSPWGNYHGIWRKSKSWEKPHV